MPALRPLGCLLTVLCLLAAGCSEQPETAAVPNAEAPPAPAATAPERPTPVTPAPGASTTNIRPPVDQTRITVMGVSGPKPTSWLWQPPQNSMRLANYIVPGKGGGNQAHLVVFAVGGGMDMNVDRWRNQFRSPEGYAVEPAITDMRVGTMEVRLVELTGEHKRTGADWFTKNQTMLAAYVVGPEQDIQITLTGDTDTVEAHRDAFMNLVNGLGPPPPPVREQVNSPYPNSWYFPDRRKNRVRYAGPQSLEGKPMPPLTIARWVNETAPIDDLAGKIVIVDFWGTWCGPCRRAIPKNVELVKRYADQGVMLIGVHDSKKGVDAIPAMIEQMEINYPVGVDDSRSQRAWKVPSWPMYAVVDRSGTVRAAGLRPQYVEAVVMRLLDE
jgi:thiol-disulfide isomerase/thioredoxin